MQRWMVLRSTPERVATSMNPGTIERLAHGQITLLRTSGQPGTTLTWIAEGSVRSPTTRSASSTRSSPNRCVHIRSSG